MSSLCGSSVQGHGLFLQSLIFPLPYSLFWNLTLAHLNLTSVMFKSQETSAWTVPPFIRDSFSMVILRHSPCYCNDLLLEFLSGSSLFCLIQLGFWFLFWFRLVLLLVEQQVLSTDSIMVLYFDFHSSFSFTCFVILIQSSCSHFISSR